MTTYSHLAAVVADEDGTEYNITDDLIGTAAINRSRATPFSPAQPGTAQAQLHNFGRRYDPGNKVLAGDFNTTDQCAYYFTPSNAIPTSDEITIAVWFGEAPSSTAAHVVSQWGNTTSTKSWALVKNTTTDDLTFAWSDNGTTTRSSQFTTGNGGPNHHEQYDSKWVRVSAADDGSTMDVLWYLSDDGVNWTLTYSDLNNAGNAFYDNSGSGDPEMYIGAKTFNSGEPFAGTLNRVIVYSSATTLSDDTLVADWHPGRDTTAGASTGWTSATSGETWSAEADASIVQGSVQRKPRASYAAFSSTTATGASIDSDNTYEMTRDWDMAIRVQVKDWNDGNLRTLFGGDNTTGWPDLRMNGAGDMEVFWRYGSSQYFNFFWRDTDSPVFPDTTVDQPIWIRAKMVEGLDGLGKVQWYSSDDQTNDVFAVRWTEGALKGEEQSDTTALVYGNYDGGGGVDPNWAWGNNSGFMEEGRAFAAYVFDGHMDAGGTLKVRSVISDTNPSTTNGASWQDPVTGETWTVGQSSSYPVLAQGGEDSLTGILGLGSTLQLYATPEGGPQTQVFEGPINSITTDWLAPMASGGSSRADSSAITISASDVLSKVARMRSIESMARIDGDVGKAQGGSASAYNIGYGTIMAYWDAFGTGSLDADVPDYHLGILGTAQDNYSASNLPEWYEVRGNWTNATTYTATTSVAGAHATIRIPGATNYCVESTFKLTESGVNWGGLVVGGSPDNCFVFIPSTTDDYWCFATWNGSAQAIKATSTTQQASGAGTTYTVRVVVRGRTMSGAIWNSATSEWDHALTWEVPADLWESFANDPAAVGLYSYSNTSSQFEEFWVWDAATPIFEKQQAVERAEEILQLVMPSTATPTFYPADIESSGRGSASCPPGVPTGNVLNYLAELERTEWSRGFFGSRDGKVVLRSRYPAAGELDLYLRHNGHATGTNYYTKAETPDSATISITGNLSVVWCVACDRWKDGNSMVGQRDNGSAPLWGSRIDASTGAWWWIWYDSASANYQESILGDITTTWAVDGQPLWFRVDVDADNGSTDSDFEAFLSYDGQDWTSVKTWTETTSGVGQNPNTTLDVGIDWDITDAALPMSGRSYYLAIYNGFYGITDPVAEYHPSRDAYPGATTWTSATGEDWTITTNSGGALKAQGVQIDWDRTRAHSLTYVNITPELNWSRYANRVSILRADPGSELRGLPAPSAEDADEILSAGQRDTSLSNVHLFTDGSGDREAEWLADGILLDTITDTRDVPYPRTVTVQLGGTDTAPGVISDAYELDIGDVVEVQLWPADGQPTQRLVGWVDGLSYRFAPKQATALQITLTGPYTTRLDDYSIVGSDGDIGTTDLGY